MLGEAEQVSLQTGRKDTAVMKVERRREVCTYACLSGFLARGSSDDIYFILFFFFLGISLFCFHFKGNGETGVVNHSRFAETNHYPHRKHITFSCAALEMVFFMKRIPGQIFPNVFIYTQYLDCLSLESGSCIKD